MLRRQGEKARRNSEELKRKKEEKRRKRETKIQTELKTGKRRIEMKAKKQAKKKRKTEKLHDINKNYRLSIAALFYFFNKNTSYKKTKKQGEARNVY